MKHFLTFIALLTTSLAFGQESCPNMYDGNGNGTVDIEDFLGVLSFFGDVDADADGLWDSQDGCSDTEACNYLNTVAGTCIYPDALGVCNGDCQADADGDGICDLYLCGEPLSFQGYEYATVLIGEQCWFAENLRSEHYANGDAIPSNLSDSEWPLATTGAVAVYGEDSGCEDFSPEVVACDPNQSLNEYGRLYNFYAVGDSRGLCPSGWHVPSDLEWTALSDELGGASIAGTHMKAEHGWNGGGDGTNSSGFAGLPGGFRSIYGYFSSGGISAVWWSSSTYGSNSDGVTRNLSSTNGAIGNELDGDPRIGFSVRCLQDSE
ncbi:MAG: fibrobacter succinogenes major paralogous domain-containing protein [Flavobacteriales bacterium]